MPSYTKFISTKVIKTQYQISFIKEGMLAGPLKEYLSEVPDEAVLTLIDEDPETCDLDFWFLVERPAEERNED